jgi:hypothetical protein
MAEVIYSKLQEEGENMTDLPIPIKLKPPQGANGWMMDAGGGVWIPQGSYPDIPVPNGEKAKITFTIMNDPGQDIKFAANPMLAAVMKKKAFDKPVVSTDGHSFTVRDTNPDVEKIPYVLMFQNGVPKLDPIVDNGGGNRAWLAYSTNQWVEIGVGLLIALAIGMLVQKRFRPLG